MKDHLKRIYNLLLPSERKVGLKVILVVFLTALLDFASLASLFPLLYYLLDESGDSTSVLWFCLMAASVIMLKGFIVVKSSQLQNKYLLSLYKRLSFSLFHSYYKRGLLFIRKQGSNRLGYEVNSMTFAFSQSILAPILRIAGDCILIFLVSIALFIYDWISVLVLYASFLPFMGIYMWVVRKKVNKYGVQEQQAKREQARVVMDTFRGYTDLEVNGAFPLRQASFLQGMDKVTESRVKLDTLLRLPLLLSELSVVVGLTMLVLFGSGDVKVLVGIFAVAAFRLLPALRAILTGWTQIQNASICLDTVEAGLKDLDNEQPRLNEKVCFNKQIEINGVSYAYPNGGNVLSDFNAIIHKGEYIGFRGSSGVGKSTLFNLLLGFLRPDQGEILIDGSSLTPEVQGSWLHRVGYVPQEVFIFNATLAENIALGSKDIDRQRVMDIIQLVSMDSWLKSLSNGIDTELVESGGNLSGGQKQRIGIARAIYKDIDVLFLDEATSSLDNDTEHEINETLSRLRNTYKQLTILSIAHRESTLSYCDRIITLEYGHD